MVAGLGTSHTKQPDLSTVHQRLRIFIVDQRKEAKKRSVISSIALLVLELFACRSKEMQPPVEEVKSPFTRVPLHVLIIEFKRRQSCTQNAPPTEFISLWVTPSSGGRVVKRSKFEPSLLGIE
jgi:hypothetical protein